jgi:hypothetical protein
MFWISVENLVYKKTKKTTKIMKHLGGKRQEMDLC